MLQLRKRQRGFVLIGALVLVGGAAALTLTALRSEVAFFIAPAQVAQGAIEPGKRFRLGGLVVPASIRRDGDGTVRFALTDQGGTVEVAYRGILPDLFREGQGIIADGALSTDRVFVATEVLAKHDENYMPREIADALKAAGHWQPEGETPAGAPR